jgi:hypothetical protein
MAIVRGIDAGCSVETSAAFCIHPNCKRRKVRDPRLDQAMKIWYCDDDNCSCGSTVKYRWVRVIDWCSECYEKEQESQKGGCRLSYWKTTVNWLTGYHHLESIKLGPLKASMSSSWLVRIKSLFWPEIHKFLKIVHITTGQLVASRWILIQLHK